jgi:putative transposase
MSAHLSYDKHDRMGRMVENSRNGSSVKTVRTEIGDVPLAVPRTARVDPSR